MFSSTSCMSGPCRVVDSVISWIPLALLPAASQLLPKRESGHSPTPSSCCRADSAALWSCRLLDLDHAGCIATWLLFTLTSLVLTPAGVTPALPRLPLPRGSPWSWSVWLHGACCLPLPFTLAPAATLLPEVPPVSCSTLFLPAGPPPGPLSSRLPLRVASEPPRPLLLTPAGPCRPMASADLVTLGPIASADQRLLPALGNSGT